MFGQSKTHFFQGGSAAGREKPLRDELLSIEGLEETAKALAARFTIDPNPVVARGASFGVSTITLAFSATRTARWPTRCTRGNSSRRQRNGSSITSTWWFPRSGTSATTFREATTASSPSSPCVSSRVTPRLRHGGIAHPPQRQSPGPTKTPAFVNSYQTSPRRRSASCGPDRAC